MSRFFERSMGLPPAHTRAVNVERDLRVPMDDGVILLADRYAPAGADKPPLVLVRCPYGRRGPWGLMAGRLFAERGFQSVVQSCRGTFRSGGEIDPLGCAEQGDGVATVEWLRSQPWYPGSFATWGPSYLGVTQWALAAAGLPDHKAMSIQVSSTRPRELIQSGGSFALETMLEWTDQVAHQERPGAMVRQQLRARAIRKLHGHLPLGDVDQLATGEQKPYWQAWLADDEEFWARHCFVPALARVTASVDMIGGWHDIFLPAQLRDYVALRAAGHQPLLTIGPWRHADNAAAGEWVRRGLEFLRARLDGSPAEPPSEPVRVFVTGAEQWRDLADWPPATNARRWYLQPDARLGGDQPAECEPDEYTYDPAYPTPNLAGPVGLQGVARVDNRMLEARPDVLTFTSRAINTDIEVIGVPSVELHVASDREHTDVFARLCEVEPTGRSINISDGLLRLSPGVPPTAADGTRHVTFELWPVAHRFSARNRIRLQVSSGAHPRYARNTGTGESPVTATRLLAARQRVYHDADHPSAVILPVTS